MCMFGGVNPYIITQCLKGKSNVYYATPPWRCTYTCMHLLAIANGELARNRITICS